MSLDAGSVFTLLGFKVDPAAAKAYEERMKQAAAAGDEFERRQVASAGRVTQAHERVARSAGNVRAATGRMVENAPLRAMDSLAKNSSQAQKNLSQLGNVAAKGAAIGIVAVGAATVYAAKKASDFNREMLKISTQAGGSAQEVQKMKAAVLGLAGTVPQGPQQLAEGLYHIQSAGFRGGQALEMLKAAAEGAALGNADLQATTQAMIAAMASNIKGVHGSADAMGQLNDIVGVGDMRMEQLAQAMATGILPSAHDAGLSLKDVGAALATVTDNATPANVTATRLRMTIALMAAPSKAATKELESIGLTSTSLAHDMRQPNGLLKAIEDLKTHLHASGKSAEEQDAVISKVFGGGKSSAVIHTLISETDRLRNKYDQLGKSDGPSKLAKSWAEFQKSEAAGFGELKSGAEAFAITIGNVLMPSLTKLAHGGAKDLQGFISSGGAAQVGHDIEQAFSTVGTVFSNLAPPIEATAKALLDVGKAAGLTNGSELSALIAGFLAFKGATFVAPILASIAGGITEVGIAAATAPSIAAFGGDLVALAGGPAGAIALALAGVAAAFVAINSGMFDSTSAAEKNASALERDKQAIEALKGATTAAAEAEQGHARAKLDKKAAEQQLRQDEKAHGEGKASGLQVEQDRLHLQEAGLRVEQSRSQVSKSIATERQKAESAVTTAGKRRGELEQELAKEEKQAALFKGFSAEREDKLRNVSRLNQELNRQKEIEIQKNAEVATSELSRLRLAKGVADAQIKPGNAQAINQLQVALSGLPQKVKLRFELSDQGTMAKLGTLAHQLEQMGQGTTMVKILTTAPSAGAAVAAFKAVVAGVPGAKVLHILHNAPSARSAMEQLNSAVRALHGKTIPISTTAASAQAGVQSLQSSINAITGKAVQIVVTTVQRAIKLGGHASGRGGGQGEVALVGEGSGPEYVVDSQTGQGTKVDRPTLMGLAPQDYVVPLEDRYRGRALGLFAMLARDLGVQGYKGGKKPAHPMPVPDAIPPLSLPLGEIESKQGAAKSAYDKWHSSAKSLSGQVTTASRDLRNAKTPATKHKDSEKLNEAQGKLRHAKTEESKRHKELQEWNRTLREAKHFDAEIKKTEQEVSNDRAAMAAAAAHGNYGAYTAAKAKRLGALGHLQSLVKQAQAQVKVGSLFGLELEGKLQGFAEEATQTEAEEPPALTPEQEHQRKQIEAAEALAALTPGLGDDTAAAQQLVSFFESALGSAQARGAGPEAIAELAGDIKTARSNLESLTNPASGATNENADVQAQLNQANERAEAEKRRANIAEDALGVFGGPGDIGAGGATARAAVVVNQTINSLHPGDPAIQLALANTAAAGFGLQGSRQSSRIQVGP